jgi:hypothetical protein
LPLISTLGTVTTKHKVVHVLLVLSKATSVYNVSLHGYLNCHVNVLLLHGSRCALQLLLSATVATPPKANVLILMKFELAASFNPDTYAIAAQAGDCHVLHMLAQEQV